MPRPRKKLNLKYDEISEALLRGDTLKLRELASQHGTCAPVIKRCLEEFYGDRVAFIYGRNGGVRLSNSAPPWYAERARGFSSVSPDLTGVA